MAFPTIPTTGAGRLLTTFDTTAGTATFPSLSSLTKNPGDLLIAIVAVYQSTATAGAVFSSWGGSFTEFVDQRGGTTQMSIGAAYKISTGSETGTFNVTIGATVTGHAALILMSIPGASTTTPPEGGTIAVGTTGAADPGALDPAGWGAEDTLWIAVGANGETATTGSYTGMGLAAGPPTNYGSAVSTGESGDVVGAVALAVAFRQLNASSENIGTWSSIDLSNARNVALAIAVRPLATDDGPAELASGTGTANNATVRVSPRSEAAAGTGAALDATVTTGGASAFPQVASADGTTNGVVTNHVADMPAGVTAGDLLIYLFAVNSNPVITGPGGWNELVAPTANSANNSIAAWYRFATGSEGSTVTATTDVGLRSESYILRITGAHASTPPEAATPTGSGATANPDPPSLNPAGWDAEDTLWIAFGGSDKGTDGTISATGFPSNYTNGVSQSGDTSTAGTLLYLALRELNTASEDPGTFTTSIAENPLVTTIAIRPAAAAATQPYRDAVIALAPVGYWRLGEADGETVVVAEIGPDGAYEGTVVAQNVPGGALASEADDGAQFSLNHTEAISVPNSGEFDLGNAPMSFAFWTRRHPGTVVSDFHGLIYKDASGGFAMGFDNTGTPTTGQMTFAVAGTTQIAKESGNTPDDGLWHFWVITRVGSSSGQTLVYKDGAEGTTFLTSDTITDPAADVAIGRGVTSSTWGYDGDLDEVAIFDSVLTAGEISDLYVAGSASTSGFAYPRPAEGRGAAYPVEPGGFPQIVEVAQDIGFGGSETTRALDLTVLSEINAGDLILVFVGRDGTGTTTWNSPWVELGDDQFSSAYTSVGYLIASGGETTTNIDFDNSERGSYLIVRIAAGSWDNTTVPEISAFTDHSGTAPDPASLNPSGWGTENTLWLACFASDSLPIEPTPPTDYSMVGYTSTASITSAGYVGVAKRLLNAASEDPGAWTTNNETQTAFTVAIKGAAAAAPPAEADAGLATGTGLANNARILISPNALIAAGVGTSNQPRVTIAPRAGVGTGTGLANNGSARIGAAAQIATGTGLANNATGRPNKLAPAGVATGTGLANNVIPLIKPNGGLSSGTGSALSPPVSIAPRAAAAAGTGTANNATVLATEYRSAAAGLASGTGLANNISPRVSPNAGLAAGTGTANQPRTTVSVNAGHASGTGTAYNATGRPAIAALAQVATGTGQAYNATTRSDTFALAQVASGTGAANNARPHVKPNAGNASGTGAANNASISTTDTAPAETAQGTGLANQPRIAIAPRSGVAAGTGSANNATTRSDAFAFAQAASGTGAAYDATAQTTPYRQAAAGLAAGVGASLQPLVHVQPRAGLTSGTGTAEQPTPRVQPRAQAASGTGTAYNATGRPHVSVLAELASGTGTANNATVRVDTYALAGHASGTGQAYDATTSQTVAAEAGHASGSAAASNASTRVSVNAERAEGTGTAHGATAATGDYAPGEPAEGAGTAYDTTPSVQVNAAGAAGTGVAQQPTISIAPRAAAGEGSGQAHAPTPAVGVHAEVGEGTGEAHGVSSSASINADAGLASGAGAAQEAHANIGAQAQIASGTGTANNATTRTDAYVLAGLATGTGQAYDAMAASGVYGAAEAASGTGAAHSATAHVFAHAEAANGTGTANDATASTESQTYAQAEIATGTGSAYDASTLIAPQAGASGAGQAEAAHSLVAVNGGVATGTGAAHDATAFTASSASFGLDAVLLAEQSGTFSLNAVVRRTYDADFGLDAMVRETAMGGFSLEAVLLSPQTETIGLDAVIFAAGTGTLSLAAIIRQTFSATFGLDAYVVGTTGGSFSLAAVIKDTLAGDFGLSAVITTGNVPYRIGFTLEADLIGLTASADQIAGTSTSTSMSFTSVDDAMGFSSESDLIGSTSTLDIQEVFGLSAWIEV